MKSQAACVILLCLSYCGACSADANDGWKATERELLSTLLASKVGVQSSPYWRATVPNVCGLLTTLNQDALLPSEENLDTREQSSIPRTLEEVQNLQVICSIIQPWKLEQTFPEYFNPEKENSENVPKRKIPYILKRQLQSKKSRRPYILKRNVDY